MSDMLNTTTYVTSVKNMKKYLSFKLACCPNRKAKMIFVIKGDLKIKTYILKHGSLYFPKYDINTTQHDNNISNCHPFTTVPGTTDRRKEKKEANTA